MADIRELAAQTPDSRNRAIDFYRAAALIIVVLGHWLASAVYVEADGALRFTNILELADWTHWLTWVIQVIPVFFIVGGYANWLSYHSAVRHNRSIGSWITARFRRLMTPVVPFLAVWTVISVGAGLLGVDHSLIRAGSFAVVTPLWFLAVYLVVILAVPVTVWLWTRIGWWSVVFGLALAFAVDWLRYATGYDWIGWLNFGFVWLTAHQLGYRWATERTAPAAAPLFATIPIVLGVMLGLTLFGPYPISMVGVPGATANNTLPPTAVLAVLAILQYAVVRLLEPAAGRLMHRTRPWLAVVSFHVVMMTVYIWHLPTMAIVVLVGYWAGFGFSIEPLTAEWWLTRPVWIVVLSIALAGVIAVFGRFEPRVRTGPPPPFLMLVFGVVASIVAISAGVVLGFVPEEGLIRWWVVILFAAGVIALGAFPSRPERKAKAESAGGGPPASE